MRNTAKQAEALKVAAELVETILDKLVDREELMKRAAGAIAKLETFDETAANFKRALVEGIRDSLEYERQFRAFNYAFFGVNPADYPQGVSDPAFEDAVIDASLEPNERLRNTIEAIKAAN